MSIYNEDELQAPTWLNNEFFELVLSTYEKDEDIEIINLDISPASLKGDHYGSVMFRVKLTYKSGRNGSSLEKSVVVKTLPDEGAKRDILMQLSLFEIEIDIYAKALPKIEQVLAAHGDPTRFAPKLIYHSLQPNKVIIMEDLCAAGYKVLRGRFTTEQETLAIYRKLAKLHAVSFMLAQTEEHELVDTFTEGAFGQSFIWSTDLAAKGIQRFIEMLTSYDELYEYADKFRAMEKQLISESKGLFLAHKNGVKHEIYVLNHGDFHFKNFMFKCNEQQKFEDFMMLDFQGSVFGPPTIDLTFSKYMVLSPELRPKYDYFERQYFEQFIETLERIKFQGKTPAFADFKMADLRYRHFSLFLLSSFLPIAYSILAVPPEQAKEVFDSEFGIKEDNAVLLFRNPAFVAEIKELLPKLLEAGYLD